MIKPIKQIINKLYYKYGDVQKPECHEIIVDKTQLNHYKVCERYDRITYEHLYDDGYYFEEMVKDRLVDRLSEVIHVTKRYDVYRNGDIIYEAEIWVRE